VATKNFQSLDRYNKQRKWSINKSRKTATKSHHKSPADLTVLNSRKNFPNLHKFLEKAPDSRSL
jgi:hypothetical protein